MTKAYKESNNITTTEHILYRNLKITSALNKIYNGIYKKTHTTTELTKDLRLNLFIKSPFDPIKNYTIHKITLDPDYNIPDYTGTTIEYISTLPASQTKK